MNNNNDSVGFAHIDAAPFCPEVTNYMCWAGRPNTAIPYEYEGWQKETMLWKESCYIHSFLSGPRNAVSLKGPDAERLLSENFVNSFDLDHFKVGRAKHIVACTPKGTIGDHGMCLRKAEDEFLIYLKPVHIPMLAASGKYCVEPFDIRTKAFNFQIAGPRSLEIVENAIGEDIHDLPFMAFRYAKILGYDVRVLRMGMGGSLSYEIHGSYDHIFEIYNEILRVGKSYGLGRLGILSYMCNHTENGFPQVGLHFLGDWENDPRINKYMGGKSVNVGDFRTIPLKGSLADMGRQEYYLNPIEAAWDRSINWNHEFVGKEALLKIKGDPNRRQVVTLEWNSDDIINIIKTYFDEAPGVAHQLTFPKNTMENASGQLQNKVLDKNGNFIGKSTDHIYTLYYKKMISMGFVELPYTEEGKEVIVIWGEPGTRQIPIRAKVARYPYLNMTKNKDFDVETIPHYRK